jgi:Flp pilus assembly protein TadG
MRRLHNLRNLKDERGQAITEFALVMPLLFILIFAIVECGLTLNNYLRLTDAVRVAARAASINGSDGYSAAFSAANTALTDSVDGLPLQGVKVTPVDSTWTSGHPVAVEASTQYAVKLPLFGTILSGTLTSRSTQRIE